MAKSSWLFFPEPETRSPLRETNRRSLFLPTSQQISSITCVCVSVSVCVCVCVCVVMTILSLDFLASAFPRPSRQDVAAVIGAAVAGPHCLGGERRIRMMLSQNFARRTDKCRRQRRDQIRLLPTSTEWKAKRDATVARKTELKHHKRTNLRSNSRTKKKTMQQTLCFLLLVSSVHKDTRAALIIGNTNSS